MMNNKVLDKQIYNLLEALYESSIDPFYEFTGQIKDVLYRYGDDVVKHAVESRFKEDILEAMKHLENKYNDE